MRSTILIKNCFLTILKAVWKAGTCAIARNAANGYHSAAPAYENSSTNSNIGSPELVAVGPRNRESRSLKKNMQSQTVRLLSDSMKILQSSSAAPKVTRGIRGTLCMPGSLFQLMTRNSGHSWPELAGAGTAG